MRQTTRNPSFLGPRLCALAIIVGVTTGQAATDGCAGAPEEQPVATSPANTEVAGDVEADQADSTEPVQAAIATDPDDTSAISPLVLGKYPCWSSAYVSGSYEYTPRGSLVLSADGAYSYLGFEEPSVGRYSRDAASGEISLEGGYLNGGMATPVEDRPNKFFLVFPTMPGGRWTCTHEDQD
jgi:hypothetical protein